MKEFEVTMALMLANNNGCYQQLFCYKLLINIEFIEI